jgi:hypothetical protein
MTTKRMIEVTPELVIALQDRLDEYERRASVLRTAIHQATAPDITSSARLVPIRQIDAAPADLPTAPMPVVEMPNPPKVKKRRKLSPQGRAAIAAAQIKRWAGHRRSKFKKMYAEVKRQQEQKQAAKPLHWTKRPENAARFAQWKKDRAAGRKKGGK